MVFTTEASWELLSPARILRRRIKNDFEINRFVAKLVNVMIKNVRTFAIFENILKVRKAKTGIAD
jgi:hypothetical protein